MHGNELSDYEKMVLDSLDEGITLTVKEIQTKLNLSRRVVRRRLKKLKKRGFVDGVRASENPFSKVTPEVWYSLTDNREINRIKRIRALFKSASPTHGVKLFEYQIHNPISTREEISHGLNVPKQILNGLFERLKKYNLAKNVPYVCWYSPMLTSEGTVKLYQMAKNDIEGSKEALKLSQTVDSGIDGFKIDIQDMIVAIPEKQLSGIITSSKLREIANLYGIAVRRGNDTYIPSLKDSLTESYSLYGEISMTCEKFGAREIIQKHNKN